MWQNTVNQSELKTNFAGLVSRIEEGQKLRANKGQKPVVRLTPMTDQAKPVSWDELRVRFAEFEFPFP